MVSYADQTRGETLEDPPCSIQPFHQLQEPSSPRLRSANRGSEGRSPTRDSNERSQAEVPKRKFSRQSSLTSSQAQCSKPKILPTDQANLSTRKFPSEGVQRKFPSDSSQANVPKRKFLRGNPKHNSSLERFQDEVAMANS